MSDAFSKMVAILLAVVMMYIVPVFYMREEADRLRQTYILETIVSFTDGVRSTGILGKKDYDVLMDELGGLNEIYTLELTHCISRVDNTTNVSEYYADRYYNEQILSVFEAGEDYYLKKADYLKVVVKDRNKDIIAWYGGSVRYEAY